jgi:hypothetical protein
MGLSYPVNGLTAGEGVSVSCQANNDNLSGDGRGFVVTTFVYLANGTVSRRFDTTTGALHTWQTLTQRITIQPGEDHLVSQFYTGFGQPKGFVDNIAIVLIPPASPAVFYQGFEIGTTGSLTQVPSSGNVQSPSSAPPTDANGAVSVSVGRVDGSGYAQFSKSGLSAGAVVNVSALANNDNTSGDGRGAILSTWIYSGTTLSRRIDVTTSALQTWQALQQSFTLASGETSFVSQFYAGFSQPKVFFDNILGMVQPAP